MLSILTLLCWSRYNLASFAGLAAAIDAAAFKNDASDFALPAITHNQPLYSASSKFANVAISSQDYLHQSSPSDMLTRQLIGKAEAPLMRGVSAEQLFVRQDTGWPEVSPDKGKSDTLGRPVSERPRRSPMPTS